MIGNPCRVDICSLRSVFHPCLHRLSRFFLLMTRFTVAKNKERAEVKVQEGPEGFDFKYGEKYIFKYSFKAKKGMKVSKRFTHLGQLKGSKGGKMIKGDPIYSLTANNKGLMVRFSNHESIPDYHPGMETYIDWDDVTGEWVNVKITTVFGKSMEASTKIACRLDV